MFGELPRGMQGTGAEIAKSILAQLAEKPINIFEFVPSGLEYGPSSSGSMSKFGDLLASRFVHFIEILSKRKDALENDSDLSNLVRGEDITAMWSDVKDAAEHILGDSRLIKPVENLWQMDNYFGIHSVDVGILSLLLASSSDRYAGKKDELIDTGVAGLLHDVGKEADIKLYTKVGKFSDEEFQQMKRHPLDSVYLISKAIKALPAERQGNIIAAVRQHHENFNGTGYPYGLRGEKISVAGRVLRIADSIESGTSWIRTAKYNGPPKNREEIMKDIQSNSGRLYCPYFVGVLKRCYDSYLLDQARQARDKETRYN
jgi:HD-GYP domain-containing protein (c-di-GMP phosphodiesterase class II)